MKTLRTSEQCITASLLSIGEAGYMVDAGCTIVRIKGARRVANKVPVVALNEGRLMYISSNELVVRMPEALLAPTRESIREYCTTNQIYPRLQPGGVGRVTGAS